VVSPRRRYQAVARPAIALLFVLLTSRAPAPIYGGFPGVGFLCEHSDEIVVAEKLTCLPSEPVVMGDYQNYQITIRKAFKGVLKEGTSLSVNLRFLGMASWDRDDWQYTTSTAALDKIAHQLVRSSSAPPARALMFLTHDPGIVLGHSDKDMHPFNGNEWSCMNYVGNVIPLCESADTQTCSSENATSQVATLLLNADRTCSQR
jgi:hypothetical protein